MEYAGLIVAAGLSSRMHAFKPLLRFGDTTFIGNIINNFKKAGVQRIVVVTGHNSDLLCDYLSSFDVITCKNEDYAESMMFDSVRLGLSELGTDFDYFLFSPGDVPFVSFETVVKVRDTVGELVRPVCDGRIGHPVKIAAKYIPNILTYSGERGLRGAMESFDEKIVELAVDDLGSVTDIDTPEDLKRMVEICDMSF